ncbi:MAG: triose-phosphate isomerase [Clostridia bacterium]
MVRQLQIKSPFFEIGPKNYLYGDQILDLARIADEAAVKYGVTVIFTTPYVQISQVANTTKNLLVFAPHMDDIEVGRGLASVLAESVKSAGAAGVMLNHVEKPLPVSVLCNTIRRARSLDLLTIACADSIVETKAVAQMFPDLMITEPAELIGTGVACNTSYVQTSMKTVLSVQPNIGVLVGGGVYSGDDVYRIIYAGADATGSSSGIAKAKDPESMVREMLSAVRDAWDARPQPVYSFC